jgi:hypothetical protein
MSAGFKVLLLSSCLAAAGSGLAEPCPSPAAERNDPAAYARAFVGALAIAEEATSSPPSQPPTAGDPAAKARAFIAKMERMQRDFECAASQVEAYTTSDSDAIQASAGTVSFVFMALRDLSAKNIDAHRRFLDGTVDVARLTYFMEKSGELADEAWRTLPGAAVTASRSMVELDADGRSTGRLHVTKSQRDELRELLGKRSAPSSRTAFRSGRRRSCPRPPLSTSSSRMPGERSVERCTCRSSTAG